jgi:hypothetical protein
MSANSPAAIHGAATADAGQQLRYGTTARLRRKQLPWLWPSGLKENDHHGR